MKTERRTIIVSALLGGLFLVSVVLAAPTASILDRYVMSGGGGHAEVGIYALDGTIGQPVAGADSTAPYDLGSGFWCGLGVVDPLFSHYLYLPLVLRQAP